MPLQNTYFDDLIKGDPNLSNFREDLGLKLLSQNLEFKLSETLKQFNIDMRETRSPSLEKTLLAHLLFKVGYIRFKKPLRVRATVKNGVDKILPKGARFTDGEDIYYTEDATDLIADTEKDVILIAQNIFEKNYTISGATLYYKIPTFVTYKDLYRVEITKGTSKLKFSQNFVASDSEFSYEVHEDGLIYIVVLLGNKLGK